MHEMNKKKEEEEKERSRADIFGGSTRIFT